MKRMIALLLAGLLLSMTALAYAGGDPYPRQTVPVDNIELIDTLDAVTLRATGTLSDSCNELMWAWGWSNDVLFIDLYREIRPEVACTAVETPYEFVVPIETTIREHFAEPAQFVLVVNGKMLRVDWQPGSSDLPYTLQLSKGVVRVETVALTDEGRGVRLTGQMGCGTLIARTHQDWQVPDGSVYQVEAYLAIDPAMMCIAGIVPFEVTVASDAPRQVESYEVNGFLMPQEFVTDPTGQVYSIMDLPVDEVEFVVQESFPPLLNLTVRGTTDGCDFPVQVVFEPILEGLPYITARVARVAPLAIACPAVAVSYMKQANFGGIAPGEYMLIVNGEERGSVGF